MRSEAAVPRIAVVDIWHQGAVLAAGLAEAGHEVVGLSLTGDARRLTGGDAPVDEPGLGDLIRATVSAGRLRFTDDPADAIPGATFVFLASDTPVDDDDRPQLGRLFAATRLIAPHLDGPVTFCVSAQVPVGTTEALADALRAGTPHPVSCAYVPEFLQLGQAVDRFRNADCFVVGAEDEATRAAVAALFAPLGRPMVETSVRTAEMAKHAANAFLATSVSFINEIADLCEATGADATEVARILRLDHRIGPQAYLGAGLGFSGGTLGRELRTLQAVGSAHGVATPLTDAVWETNTGRVDALVRLVERVAGSANGRAIAVAGLAYKAGTPTLRRSRPLEVVARLAAAGWCVHAFDPLVPPEAVPPVEGLTIARSLLDAAAGCVALLALSGGVGIADVDLGALARVLDGRVLIDAAGAFDERAVAEAGFSLSRLGHVEGTP